MRKLTYLLLGSLLSLLLSACQLNENSGEANDHSVPMPNEMKADIQVTGRLSKLIDMDIQHVGKNIPSTYSNNKIFNSPGYEWWVSKHFAIKSDLPEKKVKLYLELLELSYPHYVRLFGAEPPNISQQRIAVVYGSSRESTRETMFDDGFTRGVHKNAGGETMYYNRAGYSFPSHREHHQRYIVIHETMHAYHMALTGHSTWAPNWITEGLADGIASHVYYPERDELAVMVFDRAPMNYIHTGLRQYAEGNQPSIEQINNDPALKRGLNFFIVHFLLSDPNRAYYFSLFRDRLMAANPHSDDTLPTANRLLKQTFPNWPELEKQFAEFVRNIKPTFHIAYGPWEQNGNQYWIRSNPGKIQPRLDLRNNFLSETSSTPLQSDFPQPERSPLVPIALHLDMYQSGLLVNYEPEQIGRGEVGLALGLRHHPDNKAYLTTYQNIFDSQLDSSLQLIVHQGRKITIEGNNLDFGYRAFALNSPLQNELQQTSELGIWTYLLEDRLAIELRTANQSQTLSIEISDKMKRRIQGGDLSLLANNARHKLTPYLPKQKLRKDYFQLTDTTQWTANRQLYRIFKTCEEFDLKCDSQLEQVIGKLKNAKPGELNSQIDEILQQTVNQVKGNNAALAALAGIELKVVFDDNQQPNIEVLQPDQKQATILSQISWYQDEKKITDYSNLKSFPKGRHQFAVKPSGDANKLVLKADVEWRKQKFTIHHETTTLPFDGVYLILDKQQSQQQAVITAKLSGPYSGDTTGKLLFERLPSKDKAQLKSQDVAIKPYETKSWQQTFELNADHNHQSQAVEVKAQLVVDGEDILLSEIIYLD